MVTKIKYWSVLAALSVSANFVLADISSLDLPDFGDSAGSVVSPEQEQRMGKAFLRYVRSRSNIIYDPEVEDYINTLGYELATNSDRNTQPFTFFVVNDPMINAFAGPGGVIGMNSGVILNSRNESELAAVMAHEIAHVTQRHMARMFERADQMSLPMAAAMLGAIVLATQNPEAGAAALVGTAGLQIQDQINFTRSNEEEADRIGMQILERSGFDPRGMPGFFERLQQSSKYYQGNAPEFLRTHPLTDSRIADSRARAEEFPVKEIKDSKTYLLVQARIRVFTFKSPNDAVKYFAQALEEAEGDKDHLRYGYALALTEAEQFERARSYLELLLKGDDSNISYMIALGNLEHKQGNYARSIAIYKDAYKYYPDHRGLVFYYSKTLLDAKLPEEARQILRRYGSNHEPDLTYYNLLAQAEGQSGMLIESGITKAEYFYLLGDTELAIKRLQLAKTQGTPDYYQTERIDARLAQLEYELGLEEALQK